MPSYIQRANGTWAVRWLAQHPGPNEPRQPQRGGFPTKDAAQRWYESQELLNGIATNGTPVAQVIREHATLVLDEIIRERFAGQVSEVVRQQIAEWKPDAITGNPSGKIITKTIETWRSEVQSYNSALATGSVYFVHAIQVNLVKIGCAERGNLEERVSSLQTASPDRLRLVRALPGGQPFEAHLHRHFSEERQHGEWFLPSWHLLRFIDDSLDLDIRLPQYRDKFRERLYGE